MSVEPVLKIEDLCVEFATYGGAVKAVRGVSYEVMPGQTNISTTIAVFIKITYLRELVGLNNANQPLDHATA